MNGLTHAFDNPLSTDVAVTHISILDFIPFKRLFDSQISTNQMNIIKCDQRHVFPSH